MRRNTLEKVALALETLQPEINVPSPLREKALKPIQRMLDFAKANLPTFQGSGDA